MLNKSPFFYFLTLLLFKQKSKHVGAIILSIVIIFLLSSTLFISTSLQKSMLTALESQPDMVLTRIQAGRAVNTPLEWSEKIADIKGVSQIVPRIYGHYFTHPKEQSFLILGVDFFDESNQKELAALLNHLDLKDFFATESMIVGKGVHKYMQEHFYKESFSFKLPQGGFKKVRIFDTLPSTTNLFSNDIIVMPIELAREIFGMSEKEVTDITFNVVNISEWDTVLTKLHLLFFDLRVVDKIEITKAYTMLYNYKGGLFIILYIITLATFMLILYQRYSMVYSTERKEIGVLRALGWSIRDLLRLKFYETLIVVISSYVIGVTFAYGYVYILNAPLLREIFLGGENLPHRVEFVPAFDFGLLCSIFLLYAISFLFAVLIPTWRVATTPPQEAMR